MGTIFKKEEQEFRATADLDADLTAQLKRIDLELAALARDDAPAAPRPAAPVAATPAAVAPAAQAAAAQAKAAVPTPARA